MSDKYNNIDYLFYRELKDFSVKPPEDIWESIEKELQKEMITPVVVKTKSIVPHYYKYAAVFALLVSLSLSAYLILGSIVSDMSGSYRASVQASPINQDTETTNALSFIEIEENFAVKIPTVNNDKNLLSEKKSIPVMVDTTRELRYQASTNPPTPVNKIHLSSINTIAFNSSSLSHVPVKSTEEKTTTPPRSKGNWSVSANFSPVYSYRDTRTAMQELNQHESGIYSYSGGISGIYHTQKRLSFQVGINYFQTGVMNDYIIKNSKTIAYNPRSRTKPIDITSENDPSKLYVSSSSGSIEASDNDFIVNEQDEMIAQEQADNYILLHEYTPLDGYQIVQKFNYLEFPFITRYKLINKKTSLSLIGGLSSSFLLNNKVLLSDNGGQFNSIGITNGIRQFNLVGNIGIGIQTRVSREISLSFEPTFKYYLTNINTSGSISNHPYLYGLYTGVIYHF